MTDLDEMARLVEQATEGPWEARSGFIGPNRPEGTSVGRPGHDVSYPPDTLSVASLHDGEYIKNENAVTDGNFIAAARTWVPAAIRELRAARAVVHVAREYSRFKSIEAAGRWQTVRCATEADLMMALAEYEEATRADPT